MGVEVACVVAVVEVVVVAPGPGQGQVRGPWARLPACVRFVAPTALTDWASLVCRLLAGTRTHHALHTSNTAAVHRI
jgi:hypothetical protein